MLLSLLALVGQYPIIVTILSFYQNCFGYAALKSVNQRLCESYTLPERSGPYILHEVVRHFLAGSNSIIRSCEAIPACYVMYILLTGI